MSRATQVRAQHSWSEPPADTVVLDFDDRHRRRMAMTGPPGLALLLALEKWRGRPRAAGRGRLASRHPSPADTDHAKRPAHPARPCHRGDGEGTGDPRHR